MIRKRIYYLKLIIIRFPHGVNIIVNFLLVIAIIIGCCYIKLTLDDKMIEWYIKICAETIKEFFMIEENKILYGKIPPINKNEILYLTTTFYKNCIINKEHIILFLAKLDWYNIIEQNDHEIIAIKEVVFKKYEEYILVSEIEYQKSIIIEENIIEIILNAIKHLENYSNSLLLSEAVKQELSSKDYLKEVINSINWCNYIQTKDCQLKNYYLLNDLYHKRVLSFITQSRTVLMKDRLFFIFNPKLYRSVALIVNFAKNYAKLCQYIFIRSSMFKNFLEGIRDNNNRRYLYQLPLIKSTVIVLLDVLNGYYKPMITAFLKTLLERRKNTFLDMIKKWLGL